MESFADGFVSCGLRRCRLLNVGRQNVYPGLKGLHLILRSLYVVKSRRLILRLDLC